MTEYRPGVRGWWAHLGQPELWAEVRADGFERGSRTVPLVLGMLARRARPSDRLRQATAQLDTLRRRSTLLEGLDWSPVASRAERRVLRRALLSLLPPVRVPLPVVNPDGEPPTLDDVAEEAAIAEHAEAPTRACGVCGCTDARACPGGCWWVGPELCSACRPVVDGLGAVAPR